MLFHNLPVAAAVAVDAAAPVEEQAKESIGSLILNTTLTGLLVVFSVLLILIALVTIYSKIVHAATVAAEKKAQQKAEAKAAARAKDDDGDSPVYIPAAPQAPAKNVGGVNDDIIAVIAAAVASIDRGFSIKSVRRADAPARGAKSGRRSAWGSAALRDNTRPF